MSELSSEEGPTIALKEVPNIALRTLVALLAGYAIFIVATSDRAPTRQVNTTDDSGGFGITYTGKPGIEISDNIYLDMDGGIGFGP